MPKRFALCFLLALLVLLPWLALAQVQPIAVVAPEVTFDGTGQAAIAAVGTVTFDIWQVVTMFLAALLPAMAGHLSAFVSSNRPWMKIFDLIAGNYLAARNDATRQ